MSGVYDSWEKLVGAVLEREELRQLAFCESFSTIATDSSSRFDSDSVLEEMPIEVVPDDKSAIHFETTNSGLLQIEPHRLHFPFKLKKHISYSIALTNNSDNHVAFKLKVTSITKYAVKPNAEVVMPHSTRDVIVQIKAHEEAPPHMQCKDKFLLLSVVVSPRVAEKGIIPREIFNKESGNQVYECKLRTAYVMPPRL